MLTAARQYETGTSGPRDVVEQSRKTGSVPATANRIACQVDQLDATEKELFERLTTVLSTHPGAGAVNDRDAKCAQSCELASHLDGVSDRIASVSMMLRDIIERLEL